MWMIHFLVKVLFGWDLKCNLPFWGSGRSRLNPPPPISLKKGGGEERFFTSYGRILHLEKSINIHSL